MTKRYIGDGGLEKLGSELPFPLQRQAFSIYVNRYTGQHKPSWANSPRKDGKPYPVQFKDDQDWLAHTRFCVYTRGSHLYLASAECRSSPTWPNNPELRYEINARAAGWFPTREAHVMFAHGFGVCRCLKGGEVYNDETDSYMSTLLRHADSWEDACKMDGLTGVAAPNCAERA